MLIVAVIVIYVAVAIVSVTVKRFVIVGCVAYIQRVRRFRNEIDNLMKIKFYARVLTS